VSFVDADVDVVVVEEGHYPPSSVRRTVHLLALGMGLVQMVHV
jgi:hypothetical protein